MWKKLLWAVGLWGLWTQASLGAPEIHVAWADPGRPGPYPGDDYVVDDDPPNQDFPNVALISGSLTWFVWSRDSVTSEASDIGTISCPHPEIFGVTIADPNNASALGARIVKGIDFNPTGSLNYANLKDGSIDRLEGKLKLKRNPLGGGVSGKVVGNFHVGTIIADEINPLTDSHVYQLDIYGGVQGGHLTIDSLGAGVNTYIGPVYRYARVDIGQVGASLCLYGPCSWLFISDYDEAQGEVHLHELQPEANVIVGCGTIVVETEDCNIDPLDFSCCSEVNGGLQLFVDDQMDGETEVGAGNGAKLNHRGLFGTQTNGWETLNIGIMERGAVLYCRAVAGTLNFKGDIQAGAIVKLGSVGYNPYPHDEEHGIVDRGGHDVAGTLLVDRIVTGGPSPNVTGQIINGGDVSGKMQVSGAVDSYGVIELANVSGTVQLDGGIAAGGTVLTKDVTSSELGVIVGGVSGSLTVASVSGNVRVSVASGGTVTTDDLTSSGAVEVVGSLAGGLTVCGNLGGSVDVGSAVSGSLTVAGNASGSIHIGGNQSGPMSIGGDLASGGSVTVDGRLTGTAQINVSGLDSGTITVKKGTASATLIQAKGGLASTGLITTDSAGGSGETTGGTIWIGGATSQSPLPTLTMDGAVHTDCSGGAFAGIVKVVGCASQAAQHADICLPLVVYGNHPIRMVNTGCTYSFVPYCSSSCP